MEKSYKLLNLSLTVFLVVYTISGQVTAQEYFNNFPKPKNGNTYVIAHRGVHNDIPENTLAAYQKAIDL
ncbi:MAG: glycerophosphodiester phosphodiesterase, partial [Bacteroidetes bacterium]